jgi:hypothetical protein
LYERGHTLTLSSWIAIISALIVAAGWFVTGFLNRRLDVAQKRLEYRLEGLKSFLPVLFGIQGNNEFFMQPGSVQLLETARSNFQLYGYKDEIDQMEKFIAACERQNVQEAKSALQGLGPLIRNRIRKELGIKD